MVRGLRQVLVRLHADQSGQSLVFVAMTLFILFLFVCVTVDVGDFVAQKIDAQNDADAMAVSTAVWQSRGLNTIQMLNVVKNVAQAHYLFEGGEAIFQCFAGGMANPYCWEAVLGAEGLAEEKVQLEDELSTLSLIQTFIAGVDNPIDGYALGNAGSVKASILAAIPLVEQANNNGALHGISTAVNQSAAEDLLYDPNLKIEFVQRDPAYQVFCDLLDVNGCDFAFFDSLVDSLEVDFTWAVQPQEFLEEQFTVGFGIRDIRPAPMFQGSFQARSLVRDLFGGTLPELTENLQMAIAQAKPFKADPYTLEPGNFENGMAANLLALPFTSAAGAPTSNTNCYWDVKLTPVTVLDDLAPPLAPWMTH